MESQDFASVRAWIFALHATSPEIGVSLETSSDTSMLACLQDQWDLELSSLRTASKLEDPRSIRSRLLRAGFLRKWSKLSAEAQARLDEDAATKFKERNLLVPDRHAIPESVRVIMRRLLKEWLPVPACDMPDPRLGPGAVAERYTFIQKRRLLARVRRQWMRNTFSWDDGIADHDTARLCAVPKTWNKARLITVEPYFHTLLQQAARAYVWESLQQGPLMRYYAWKHFWTRMPDCQRNAALIGSRRGTHATIDLSAASDGVSYDLVSDVFPGHVMAWLDISRTEYFSDGNETHRLRIYAGMGNATTFIVETLLFAAYVKAKAIYHHIRTGVTVFGDDIVCSSSMLAYPEILETGTTFFQINWQKTYYGSCPFRESCGTFAYNGKDLQLYWVKGYEPDRVEDALALSTLQRRLEVSEWPEDWTLSYEIAKSRVLPNLEHAPLEGLCFKCRAVPYDAEITRFNRRYQRLEVQLTQAVPAGRWVPADQQWMLDGSLLGQIRTEHRKVHGTTVPCVRLPQKGVRTTTGWYPATEVCAF